MKRIFRITLEFYICLQVIMLFYSETVNFHLKDKKHVISLYPEFQIYLSIYKFHTFFLCINYNFTDEKQMKKS